MLVIICVSNPNRDALSFGGKIIYANGEQDISRGVSSIDNPSCYDYEFSFSPDDDLSQLRFEFSSIMNWSYHFSEELVCAMTAEEQRILDEWKTGIKVSCRENGASGEWIRQIDYAPPEITNAGDWVNRASNIATDKILVTHGEWEFVVGEKDIYQYPILTLLEPDSPSPTPQNFVLQASNLRRYTVPSPMPEEIQYLRIDVCLDSLNQTQWGFWDGNLEYGGTIKRRFYVSDGDKENCKVLSFDVSPDDVVTRAHLKISGLLFPPDMSNEEKCNEYLPLLQKAINDKYFGLIIKCIRTSDERGRWGITYVTKPFWMSEFDARLLINSQELYTVKGNWEFDLTMNP
jgi:hypothetical protein